MWTYLLIFLSLVAIIVVFGRRLIFVIRGKDLELKEKSMEKESEEEGISTEKVKISRKDKSQVEDFCKKGEALMNAGNEEDAIKSFVQALALDPTHKDSMNKLGVLYMHKQMYSAASALFKDLSDLEENSVHLSHLGLALYHQKEFDRACEAYKRAVELDDTRPQRFVSLGQVYRALEKPQLAIIALNKALALDEENSDYLFLLGDLLFEIGQEKEGKAIFKKLLELDPENEEVRKLLRKKKKES